MKTVTLIIIVLSSFNRLQAQPVDPYTIGQHHKIHSQILNEDRGYCVYLPHDYQETSEAYPVLFLLDGHRHFHYVSGIVDYLSRYAKVIPSMIIVDVTQQHRSLDMTPTQDSQRPDDTGGANQFLSFLQQELIPHIDSHYRTKSPRIIVGYSLTGLFAVHALQKQPEIFDAYILSSPSIWWDDHLLLQRMKPFLQQHPELDKFIFFAIGEKERQLVQDFYQQFGQIVEQHGPPQFRVVLQRLSGESHHTLCIPGFYHGLMAMFAPEEGN